MRRIALALAALLLLAVPAGSDVINPGTGGGGGGTPGGNSGDIQINSSGSFGGLAPGSSGNIAQSTGSAWASATPASPYSCTVTAVSSIACTHNLSTSQPWVACYDNQSPPQLLGSTGATASVTSVVATSASVATLTFSGTVTGTCKISTGSMGPTGSTGATGAAGSNGTNGTNGAGYGGTSTTSLAIATGSKSFTTQSGLAYTTASRVRAASHADNTNYMEGAVTSYSSTTLVLNVDVVGGSGTKTDWDLSIIGQPGQNGAGSGTVTSVVCGAGLNGGTITSTGTCSLAPVTFATGTTHTFGSGGIFAEIWECTGACTVTPPTPAAGYQFCVRNTTGTTGVITLAGVSSVLYEKTDFSAYGTANTAATSGGAAGDKICIVGHDATHYDVLSFNGTWSVP